MATSNLTYTWKLTSVKKRNIGDLNGVILQTYWKKIGTDANGNVGEFSGATPFDPAQVNPNNFISWDQLTEEVILGWIKEVVVGSYEQHVNQQIQKQIDQKINAADEVSDGQFPWNPPSSGVAPSGVAPSGSAPAP